jgi:ABC-type uncharacterized transport system substrate-binding protein
MPNAAASASLPDRLVVSVSQPGSARMTPRLFRALLLLLSDGEPVAIDRLAAAAKRPTDDVRRAADYVDKILRGAKPSDIPVEQPTRFELVFNLTTAKALGLRLSPHMLSRADKLID